MSYVKQTWATGNVVTAAKLNHMEDGIAAADERVTEVDQKIDETVEELSTEYAKSDGSYEGMTVGNAEQLVATVGIDDSVPYTFRTSGGSADIGDRETDMVVGGTIAWNQLLRTHTLYTASGTDTSGLTISVSNGYIDISGTPANNCSIDVYNPADAEIPANHVCLIVCDGANGFTWSRVGFSNNVTGVGAINKHIANWVGRARIKLTAGTAYNIHARFSSFDLTQMFGSTIADYIYSLEQANAGAGVAFFRKLFPKPYYEYNAGELLSVNASAHKMVGFNAWDEEWEVGGMTQNGQPAESAVEMRCKNFIPALPNTQYCFTVPVWGVIYQYDSDKNFLLRTPLIGGDKTPLFTTLANTAYIKFFMQAAYGTTYKNDICINLSWSGSRNGEYEPYVEHTYPLDSSLTLRGIPKLSADNTLYYDGDTYKSDGKVTRRYGVVTFDGSSDESWSFGEYSSGVYRAYISVPGIDTKKPNTVAANIVSNRFETKGYTNWANGDCITGRENIEQINVFTTAFSDKTAFLASLAANPLVVVYELATPTEEEADPYQNPQVVNDFGTEEYIVTEQNGVAVPVGHVTTYPANLRDKLQHLPDLADADGYYMIQQTNNDMSLIRFRIPQAPTTDGEYILKATVSGGTPTYTWVSETEQEENA